MASHTLLSLETPNILLARCSGGVCAAIGAAVRAVFLLLGLFKIDGSASPTFARMMSAPVPRFASRSPAFERHLRKAIFGDRRVTEVKRPNLAVVLNAPELRTGTAFRFGSNESGSWRYGRLVKHPNVSAAVSASAAFLALFPLFDEHLVFENRGRQKGS